MSQPTSAAAGSRPRGASAEHEPRTAPARWLRLGRVALHLLAGLAAVAVVQPWLSPARRLRLRQRWSRQLVAILGIAIKVRGDVCAGNLLLANHISWVDIFVINAVSPTAFVAKAEIRGWPMIGWLAARTDTLFIERGRRHHVRHVAHAVAERLASGRSVAVFPEGTTTDGSTLLGFHAGLLQAAISAGVDIQPLALSYRDGDGRRTRAAAYDGDLSFMDCLTNILSARPLTAEIVCLPPRASAGKDRRMLARETADDLRDALFGSDARTNTALALAA